MLRVGERVRAINARWNPGYEEGDEEEEGDARVEEGFGVLLAQRDGAGDGGEAEDRRSGRSVGGLGSWWFADFDVDGVGVVVVVLLAPVYLSCLGIGEGRFAVMRGDGYFGCLHYVCEGVFVERV